MPLKVLNNENDSEEQLPGPHKLHKIGKATDKRVKFTLVRWAYIFLPGNTSR